MVDIYLGASWLSKYPPLFTDTEVNNFFSIYHTSWINSTPKSKFIFDSIPQKFCGQCDQGCPNSRKRFFIVNYYVSPSCLQIKLLQALVKLLRCHFLNDWVKFLLLLKSSWKTSDVSLFSLWFWCSTVFLNKALYFDFLP